ncbi:E3 ubiquitin-protein ligase MBR2-like [Diospyros lotus]|uniref:E3 ubiquitin-protein ligase MBR2-like n=1 Tax=Diospyros lotus TaxID=55363 RepID=UPI00225A5D58|nr:E3 ubiquitin-protein ligase MBR2-like [Diospyros lotus]
MNSDVPNFHQILSSDTNAGEQDLQRLTSATTTTDNHQIHYSDFGPIPSLMIDDEYVDEDTLPSVDEIQQQLSLVERMLIDEYVTEDISNDTNETEEQLFPPDHEDMYTLTIGEYDILHRMDEIEEQLSLYEAFVGLSDHTQVREDDRLSEDAIISHLKRRIHISSSPNQEAEICVICQAEYEEGDDIGTLRCGHGYHVDCVKKWLLKKDSCPLCKATVLNI